MDHGIATVVVGVVVAAAGFPFGLSLLWVKYVLVFPGSTLNNCPPLPAKKPTNALSRLRCIISSTLSPTPNREKKGTKWYNFLPSRGGNSAPLPFFPLPRPPKWNRRTNSAAAFFWGGGEGGRRRRRIHWLLLEQFWVSGTKWNGGLSQHFHQLDMEKTEEVALTKESSSFHAVCRMHIVLFSVLQDLLNDLFHAPVFGECLPLLAAS